MTTESSLFSFNEEKRLVFLNDKNRKKIIDGTLCPKDNIAFLEFSLDSDVLGKAKQTLAIPVQPDASNQSSSSTVQEVDQEKLKV